MQKNVQEQFQRAYLIFATGVNNLCIVFNPLAKKLA
jgi:hypothetical protein